MKAKKISKETLQVLATLSKKPNSNSEASDGAEKGKVNLVGIAKKLMSRKVESLNEEKNEKE